MHSGGRRTPHRCAAARTALSYRYDRLDTHLPCSQDAEYTSVVSSHKDKEDPVMGRLVGCLPILGALNLASQNRWAPS